MPPPVVHDGELKSGVADPDMARVVSHNIDDHGINVSDFKRAVELIREDGDPRSSDDSRDPLVHELADGRLRGERFIGGLVVD